MVKLSYRNCNSFAIRLHFLDAQFVADLHGHVRVDARELCAELNVAPVVDDAHNALAVAERRHGFGFGHDQMRDGGTGFAPKAEQQVPQGSQRETLYNLLLQAARGTVPSCTEAIDAELS